ncbi:uncharacterized protein K460DRAFT_281411 [Cucurbitaria berberidis CBS 394.84]|uniref:Uncharacterized protein n=1 Tax=Cucurbitaria berberidis CBS 394.84 TaxID=1168544 RepID=A0A9P4GKX4_9PLEO|nr:uncharacterized protein K460DRAFT_281411 [Cucurbitaria berberidis CBS 394.84]KAF1847074.1 hypothetical protein K460DRAFT_281411 [Cucurbitaria berberidis CBS 394.84]
MQPQFRFFTLPRELRDMIYEYYLTTEEGYFYNHETGQLVAANKGRVDLALAYTCTQAAAEMQGLALSLNSIHFSTAYDDALRSRAGRFRDLLVTIECTKSCLVNAIHPCIDDETVSKLARVYPQFLPIVHRLRNVGAVRLFRDYSWGEVPSLCRQFHSATLDLVSDHPDFHEAVSDDVPVGWLHGRLSELLSLDDSPWKIPLDRDISNICRILDQDPQNPPRSHECWKREKYRFSAASVAIQFLGSLPVKSRRQIRRVVLEEDRVSVAWPECHAQGLIPLCQENPLLRVERWVNLWRNVLPAGSSPVRVVAHRGNACYRVEDQMDRLVSADVTGRCIAPWIMEALALGRLGMPPESFTLILDGQPTPDKSAQVFEIVQRDAAWQAAFEKCWYEKTNPPDWFRMRRTQSFIMRGFPEAIHDIVYGHSIVQCNFELGDTWDIHGLVQMGRNWTMDDWERKWRVHEPKDFGTDPPLPDWYSLRLEEALEKKEDDFDD